MTRIETTAAQKWRIWNREGVRALAELCRPKPRQTQKAVVLARNRRGKHQDCWAWSDDPAWERKAEKDLAIYKTYGQ